MRLENQDDPPTRSTCCSPDSPARARPTVPDAPAPLYSSAQTRLSARRRRGAARAADLDRRRRRHGHQDLRLPSRRSTRSTSSTTSQNHSRGALGSRALRADPAQRSAHQALDVQRRELRLPRPGALRRHEVPQARHRRRRGQPPLDRRDATAGSPRCSITSSAPIVPPQGRAVSLHAERRRRPVPARGQRARRRPWPRARRAKFDADAVRRSEAAGAARRRPARSSTASPTTAMLYDPRAAAVLAARQGARASPATGASPSSWSPSC